jgi:hypothetical protein
LKGEFILPVEIREELFLGFTMLLPKGIGLLEPIGEAGVTFGDGLLGVYEAPLEFF